MKKIFLPVLGLGSLVAAGSAAASNISTVATTGLTAAAGDAATVGGGVIGLVLAIVGVTIIVGMVRKA